MHKPRLLSLVVSLSLMVLVPGMALAQEPTVLCNDGTISKSGRGACSHHGGVATQPAASSTSTAATSPPPAATSTAPPQQAAPAPPNAGAPAGATALCGDKTYSFSTHRSGTCSHHGGVAQWLGTSK